MRYLNRSLKTVIFGIGVQLCFVTAGNCTVIDYGATNISGNQWRYDYVVQNNTLAVPITDFTIFFDRSLYANLSVSASPSDWDSLVAQPDSQIPADGFFDALALSLPIRSGGILPGESVAGFSVLFEYIGATSPGRQAFDIVDAKFATIDSGFTQTRSTVDEPGTTIMILSSLVMLRLFRKSGPPRQIPASRKFCAGRVADRNWGK